jgi:cytoskeletal protein CcmA (bactofilin family)
MSNIVASVFRKTPEPDVSPDIDKHKITTLIARSATFRGDMALIESVHVNGTVIGNIHVSGDGMMVSLRDGGRIEGDVEADQVLIAGTVVGNIRARVLKLYGTSTVEGGISYERIMVGDGAQIKSTNVTVFKEVEINPAQTAMTA